jgi:hypothetical protein
LEVTAADMPVVVCEAVFDRIFVEP